MEQDAWGVLLLFLNGFCFERENYSSLNELYFMMDVNGFVQAVSGGSLMFRYKMVLLLEIRKQVY